MIAARSAQGYAAQASHVSDGDSKVDDLPRLSGEFGSLLPWQTQDLLRVKNLRELANHPELGFLRVSLHLQIIAAS
jgi:hypothetical protein